MMLLGFGASAANAQVCISFDSFCDGVSFTPGVGFTWEGYDCAGADTAFSGVVPTGGGEVRLVCQSGSCAVPDFFGYDIAIVDLNLPARTADVIGIDNGGILFTVTDTITVTQGACPFTPEREGLKSFGQP